MRLNCVHSTRKNIATDAGKGKTRRIVLVVAAVLAAALAGCSGVSGNEGGMVGSSSGGGTVSIKPGQAARGLSGKGKLSQNNAFGGIVLADEPVAALAGRRILEQGGNAFDAATALYFALSVTYPGAASLGGGGLCLAHVQDDEKTEMITFLAKRPAGGGALAVPGNARGFALLHARYGHFKWAQTIAPAEALAAYGFPLSRASAHFVASQAQRLARDKAAGSAFLDTFSRPRPEKSRVVQPQLAATLGLIRVRGAIALYKGDHAYRFAQAIRDAGGSVSVEDLHTMTPRFQKSRGIKLGNNRIHLPDHDRAPETRADGSSLSAVEKGRGDFPEATSFVIVTDNGDAVACALTMNAAPGTGRTATGTGVLMAAAPLEDRPSFLVPVLVTNPFTRHLFFAGAFVGGQEARARGVEALKKSVRRAGKADTLEFLYERTDWRVNAVVCPDGLPRGPEQCQFTVDPEGFGVGLEASNPER